jgi:ADP-heptose:LPS heptosyltransferase
LIDLQSNQNRYFPAPKSLLQKRLLQQIDAIDLYNDIDGLAALISNLDHVITIDNAVAHLASNIGVPTILLLSTIHDWRWLKFSQQLPWYPKTTLIRQNDAGNWDNVQAELLNNIERLVEINTRALTGSEH